jgi:hypothetical protein
MYNPEPFVINPNIREGSAVLVKTCTPEHSHTFSLLDSDDENVMWENRLHTCGYWQTLISDRLYYKGHLAPVWAMSLSGAFSDTFIGNQEKAKETFVLFAKSAKPIFALRKAGNKTFFPRGVELYEEGAWSYVSAWEGDHREFTGYETVIHDGDIVWQANFHGRTLLSTGLRAL